MAPTGSPQAPEREKIGWDEVLKEVQVDSGREVSLTRIGYNLACFLLIYLAAVSGILLVDYLIHSPSPPDTASLEATKVAHYQQLSQVHTDRILTLFDHLIIKSFLPVFTAVLGYIFGSRGVEKDNE